MTVSIVVYLDSQSPLHARHLLQGLQAQSVKEIEVQVFAPAGHDLPELPADWKKAEAASVAEAWKQGLSQASGEHIAFYQTSALLHHEHLRICLNELKLKELDAVCAQPGFVDAELMPLSAAQLPVLQPRDWPAFFLGSRLLWPIESFVFRKEALSPEAFDGLSPRPSGGDLLEWIGAHKTGLVPLPTLHLPLAAFWLSEVSEFRQQQIQQLLQKHNPAQLTPSWSVPPNGTRQSAAYLCFQSVCQALRNQGLWQYLEAYQQKHIKNTLGVRSALWLVHEDLTPWMPWLHALREQGIYPTVVVASEQPALMGSSYQVQYEQREGLALIRISGIPANELQETQLSAPPGIVPLVLELLHGLRPDRVHLTTLSVFSLFLPAALEHTNTPVYYSVSDDSLLRYRWLLRHPETQSGDKRYVRDWLDVRNRQIEQFLRQQAAAVLVHDAHWESRLIESGFEPGSYQRIDDGQALAAFYARMPVVTRPPRFRPSLPLLYEARSGRPLDDRLRHDAGHLREKGRILAYGTHVQPFVQAVLESKGWAEAALPDPLQVSAARENVLPAHLGRPEHIADQILRYDVLYTPYVFETLRLPQIRRLLVSAALGLRKKGSWAVRLLNPALQSSDSFWLDEKHLRPYPLALMRRMLTQAGYEIGESGAEGEGWQDSYLEAELRSNALPLLSLPPATEALESYWDNHPPAITFGDEDKVLLVGPHIFKTWMMYRVQCDDMLAITTNYNELLKRQKRSQKFRFRHSMDPVRTLGLIKQKFDVVMLQGLIETLDPGQLAQMLQQCRAHLNPGGRLYIQTLQLDASQDEPLFWQSLEHVRPYPELEPMLQAQGFSLSSRESLGQHLVYHCQLAEPQQPAQAMPNLPVAVKAIIKSAARVHTLESYADLLKLQPRSQSCIFAQDLLEQIPPDKLPAALQQIVQALEPDGAFVLTFAPCQEWKWQDPRFYRPYPEALVDKLLLDAGLQKRSLSHHSHRWIWCGFRRLEQRSPGREGFRLRWEGDALNYHSLAAVNRELLKRVLAETDYQVEIRNFSDPAFAPEPGSQEYPLLQHSYKPLLSAPQLTVRHHWPPDFTLPQTPGHWVMIQPWEFGALPERWIYNMNKFIDQVWVPSDYVRQSYLRSGLLPDKVAVVPNGVDPDVYTPEAGEYRLPTKKRFKFLFVGGGILRKGVDLLLNAFVETFTADEDVCLVVKEFGAGKVYRTIEIGEWLERARRNQPNMPEILHLTEDLPPEQMPALYNSCDCLVHPFRGEGFALPIAEAMACERSVLVTGYGPTLEYCDDSNAYLIPAQEVPFKEKQIDETLITVDYPYWAEPDYESLKALLRHIYENAGEARAKGRKARETIVEKWTWQHSLQSLKEQIDKLQQRPVYRFYREQLLADLLGEAFARVESQDYAVAIERFQRALQVDPYQPSVCYNLGVAYLMLANYEAALEYLTRSLREGEVTADLCYAMGTVLRHLGDYPTSQEFFGKAKELDPSLFAV